MMPELRGERRFCHRLGAYKNGYANFKVWKDMWSWDFLYSYEFEFYYGVDSVRVEGKDFALSVFQISDSGFYKVEDAKDQGEEWLWGNEFDNAKLHFIERSNSIYEIEKRFLAVTYNLEDFLNQDTVDSKLNDFSSKVEKFCGLNIMKKS